ncbi:hypothetical protein TNCV_3025291 [Trichonephila clavipes]|nr:hypothetical protein TNCV_3025291 [Trichonephila clavipes]
MDVPHFSTSRSSRNGCQPCKNYAPLKKTTVTRKESREKKRAERCDPEIGKNGHLKEWENWARAPSRSRLSLNKITIRITSTVKSYCRLCFPKNSEFWTIYQLATCDNGRPCPSPPFTIITHFVKRRQ